MASDVLAVNKTKYDAGGSGDNYIPSGGYAGPVRQVYDSYTSTAIVAGSTISIANIPSGARIRGIEINHGALGANVTLTCGDAVDPDRYFAATAAATAGTLNTILNTGMDYEIGTVATDDVIQLLTAGATLTADILVEVVVTYVQ